MNKKITLQDIRKMGKNILPEEYQSDSMKKKISEQKRKEMIKRITQASKDDKTKDKVLGALNKMIQSDEE
jgi:Na+-translocating ferredoxin:NAD+ oxidoreductase RnfG subunit